MVTIASTNEITPTATNKAAIEKRIVLRILVIVDTQSLLIRILAR
jgi:hypothetical protein